MRKLIRQLLNKAGYDIIKVNTFSERMAHKIRKVKVGNYLLDMPGNTPQINTYRYDPAANSQLGRLSACIAEKYPSLTVIDIGANVGDTIAIVKTAAELPVIGIEGDEFAYRFLERNLPLFKEVTLIKEFLGEKEETVQASLEKTGWNTTIVPSAEKGQAIKLRTLDQVLQQQQLADRTLKLLKIDTEGFDTIILRGAQELLQRRQPVIYFEYNRSNMDAIGELGLPTLFSLEQYGYHSITFFDNKGRYLLTAPLNQHELIRQLHEYAAEGESGIAYYDICLFHHTDQDLADRFIAQEKAL
ncbi:FkbM family methyltransferase [Sediminibacterium soli]|uniref:FkbM family methyltransferase n=1 Tax=Sediminibacterium soli TaxID=2698829 RepID=UPI00137AEF56|nr:FkbM family methyltransferase [Sediminibacterium soli]NCI46614.1 FkbM family methyltransferase [Sediminibacterium soli]